METRATNSFDELCSKLVAVKVHSNGPVDSAELESLRAIQANAHNGMEQSFCSLIDSGSRWLVTEAIALSVTVGDIGHDGESSHHLTPEMGLHVVLEMAKAYRFLHEDCSGTVHGDMHWDNMLLDTRSATELGFPRLVVIDFGSSQHGVSIRGAWDDFHSWVREVIWQMKGMYLAPVEEWGEVNGYLSRAASPTCFESLIPAIERRLEHMLAGKPPGHVDESCANAKISADQKAAELRGIFQEAGLLD